MQYLALALCVAALASCSRAEVQAVRSLPIAHVDLSQVGDGAYTGQYGYAGFTYEVQVTVSGHRITGVELLHNRTTKQAKMAAGVAARVVDQQRNDVDAVSGATTTSKAILKAIENALTGPLQRLGPA